MQTNFWHACEGVPRLAEVGGASVSGAAPWAGFRDWEKRESQVTCSIVWSPFPVLATAWPAAWRLGATTSPSNGLYSTERQAK